MPRRRLTALAVLTVAALLASALPASAFYRFSGFRFGRFAARARYGAAYNRGFYGYRAYGARILPQAVAGRTLTYPELRLLARYDRLVYPGWYHHGWYPYQGYNRGLYALSTIAPYGTAGAYAGSPGLAAPEGVPPYRMEDPYETTLRPYVSDYESVYPVRSGPAPTGVETAEPAPLPTANVARICVVLPPEAQLWVNGTATALTGPERSFTTASLGPNTPYRYIVRARWFRDGKPVEQVREVEVRANKTATVNFFAPAPKG